MVDRTGKTALVGEFCRRAQAAHPELVVTTGNCTAHTGQGDPYLPFREVLGQLTGDIEVRWAAGAISRDHALRLWNLLPVALQVLVEKGPDLVESFVAGGPLLARGAVCAPAGAAWLDGLRRVVERKAAMAGASPLPQAGLFAQHGRVLQALARAQPLLLVLDDLQWADAGSLDLLFQLARPIATSRILILGLYRPTEVAADRGGERHPLEPVVNEVTQVFGAVEVALGRAERHEEAGRALEALYGARADEIAGELARHYEEAGLVEQAVEYLEKAGERAKQASAYQEAIAHQP